MAHTTLAESVYRLCRVPKEKFPRARRRPLHVARDLRYDKDDDGDDHQHSTSPLLFLGFSGRSSE